MEILINELSLVGQYDNERHFIESGITPFVSILNELDKEQDTILKKTDLYSYNFTKQETLYTLLHSNISREYDVLRKFKSLLFSTIFNEPYWESNPKHSTDNSYLFKEEKEVTGFSLAEAAERDKIIISFCSKSFNERKIAIRKNETEEIILDNCFEIGYYNEIGREKGFVGFKEYCINRFKGGKLDFSIIDDKLGFKLIKPDDEKVFIDAFKKFTELEWQQISVDDGLDYKVYPDNDKVFKLKPKRKIHKFRITQKYRCFGYTDNGKFYVLLFDLEHKLSD